MYGTIRDPLDVAIFAERQRRKVLPKVNSICRAGNPLRSRWMIVALGVVGLSAEQKDRRTQSTVMLALALVILILLGPLAFTK
jgi:hypothetical protein